MGDREVIGLVVAAVLGASLWIGWALWSGDAEAWDHGHYMIVAPAASLVAGIGLALLQPRFAMFFAGAYLVSHVIAGLATMGIGNLWPITVVVLGLLVSPAILGAAVVYVSWLLRRPMTPAATARARPARAVGHATRLGTAFRLARR